MNNTGSVDVQAGYLEIKGGGAHSGSFNSVAGSGIGFNGGTTELNSGRFSPARAKPFL